MLGTHDFRAHAAEPTPVYRWSTFAGRPTAGAENGPVADALFNGPRGLALDVNGNLYVADSINHTIRKITPQGIVSTFAGSPGRSGSADGVGSAARFLLPKGVAADGQGNVYVADTGNHTVRKITPAGAVTTLAGAAGFEGSTDAVGPSARFASPSNLFADSSGNVYVAQLGVRRIAPDGTVTTINLSAPITTPSGNQIPNPVVGAALVDRLGQIYFFARSSSTPGSTKVLMKRDVSGAYSVLASSDSADGRPFISTSVDEGLMGTGADGGVYFVTQLISSIIEYRLYKLSPDGSLVSWPWSGANRGGFGDRPQGLAIDTVGRTFHTAPESDDVVFVTDAGGTRVYAGTLWSNRGLDGTGATARFAEIGALARSANGGLLVSDNYSFYSIHFYGGVNVRTVSPTGVTSMLYTGPFRQSPGEFSRALAAQPAGAVVFLSYRSGISQLTQVSSAGVSSPLAMGDMQEIRGLGADSSGALIAAEPRAIRRRAPDGTWAMVAGNNNQPAEILDGGGGAARFANIVSLDVAASGDVYVIDYQTTPPVRAAVRRVGANGAVATIIANALRADGAAPRRLAVDAKGDCILTFGDETVRLFTSSGAEFIIGGLSGERGVRDGDGQSARFFQPDAITTDAQNHVYVADNVAVTIRKGEFLGYGAAISGHPQSLTVAVGAIAQFSVTASGTPAPSYQWQFNGAAITGATASVLSLPSVSSANAGNYTVVVSNSLSSVTSNVATLTVTSTSGGPSDPPPAGGAGGGGGSPSVGFLAAMLVLSATRGWRQR